MVELTGICCLCNNIKVFTINNLCEDCCKKEPLDTYTICYSCGEDTPESELQKYDSQCENCFYYAIK